MTELAKILNNPEDHYPDNFDTPERANALLTGLCQDAAKEIAKLQYEVDAIPAIKEERDSLASELLEQSRIIAMSAEREDSLRAELTQLKASIALDKMAENASKIGLDYEPAPAQPLAHCEAGPEYCQQCHLEDRSLALAAAVRYVKNNTPKLVADEICMALTTPPAQPAPVQDLPFGVGGGLVAIKTLLSRDPCIHANMAIEMIDAILKDHPAAQPGAKEG
jgi:hypothetical protein